MGSRRDDQNVKSLFETMTDNMTDNLLSDNELNYFCWPNSTGI